MVLPWRRGGRVGRRRTTLHRRPTPHGVGLRHFRTQHAGSPAAQQAARRPERERGSPTSGGRRRSSAAGCDAAPPHHVRTACDRAGSSSSRRGRMACANFRTRGNPGERHPREPEPDRPSSGDDRGGRRDRDGRQEPPVRDVVGRAARRRATAVAGPPVEPAVVPGTSETAARVATAVGATTTVAARAAIVRHATGRAAARAGARTATDETAPAGPPTHGVGTAPTVAVRGASAVTRRAARAVSTAQRATTGRVPATVTPGRVRGATVRTVPHGAETLVAGASSATPRAGVADRADRATTAAAVTVPGRAPGPRPARRGRPRPRGLRPTS